MIAILLIQLRIGIISTSKNSSNGGSKVPKISEFLRSNFKAKCSLWIPVERKLLTAWVRTLYTHQEGVGSNQNVGGQTENRKSMTDNYLCENLYLWSITNLVRKCPSCPPSSYVPTHRIYAWIYNGFIEE